MSYQYDAFISYRRESGFPLAHLVRDLLRERGYSCFMDVEDHRPGDFPAHLLESVANSANFILILTPGDLNRCVSEEDWVRREALKAMDLGKPILPVCYGEFAMPKDETWKRQVPQELQNLLIKQAVPVSQQFLHSSIDMLCNYMKDVYPRIHIAARDRVPSQGAEFVRFCMGYGKIRGIDMAFHAGANWNRDDSHLDIVDELVDLQIPVRVLINDEKTVENICFHLRRPRKQYVPFREAIQEWAELQADHPQVFQVRVCPLPLLHRMHLVHGEDGRGYANVHYYAYGPYNPAKDSWANYDATAPEFGLYANEFEYLWNQSTPVE